MALNNMYIPLEDLDFSVRTWKCLKRADIKTLGDLAAMSKEDLMQIPNMGNKSLKEISSKLADLGVEINGFERPGNAVTSKLKEPSQVNSYWAEIRNDYFNIDTDELQGDYLAEIAIDAWKTLNDEEHSAVIANVMLSRHGDVLVDYRDSVARIDVQAQKAIAEATSQLQEYYQDLRQEKAAEKVSGMDVTRAEDGSGMVLTNAYGDTMKVSWMEFWDIVKAGDRMDTRDEVEQYLSNLDDIKGMSGDEISAEPDLVDQIVEQVISDRINNETGDQIFYAAEKCVKEYLNNRENTLAGGSLDQKILAAQKKADGRAEESGTFSKSKSQSSER